MFSGLSGGTARERWAASMALLIGAAMLIRSAGPGNAAGPVALAAYKHPKLSTILADLAGAVPQVQSGTAPGPRPQLTPNFSPGLSMVRMPKSVQDAYGSRMLRLNQATEVQVYIEVTAADESAVDGLRAAGATIEIVDARDRIVQARVPAARLEAVGALPLVRFVTLPNYGFPQIGSVDTQGDSILKDDQVRSAFHVDGTGVRVGALSDGLKGIFAACPAPGTDCAASGVTGGPISTGDLPEATGTRNASGALTSVSGGITARSFSANQDLEGLPAPGCGFAGAGAEGTALLEIIHDLAPGTQLFFANFDTSLAFEQAVNYIASNTDVGMDDISFFGLPYDGSSAVSKNTAAALNSATNPIRAWLTSAGNAATEHYLGEYVDSHTDGGSKVGATGDLHLFQGSSTTTDVLGLGPTVTDKIILPPMGEAAIVLTWNDIFGASGNDYDLYLVDESTSQVVARSTNPQTGSQDPVEFIDYTSPATSAQGFFDIIIQNVANRAAARQFNLFAFTPECAQARIQPLKPPGHERHNYNTPSGSVAAESDAGGSPASVVAVGAICSGVPQCASYPNDPNHTQIEFYSSEGPTADGRIKPDVTGIDGVAITGAGSFENPSFGTSAAAPHAAATDALLLQLAPCMLNGSPGALANTTARRNLRSLLLGNADPIGSPVPNNIYGSGRIDALAAALKTIPTLSAPAVQIVSGGGGALQATAQDPSQCPLTYSWTGTCGSGTGSAPAPNCTPGSNTVSLSVTNNGVTFSSSASIQLTATTFGVSVSPSSATVSPGQAATYTFSISPKFGAFASPVKLACTNPPAQATCSFSPASVTPGSNAANSALTISTAAATVAYRVPFEPDVRAGIGRVAVALSSLTAILLAFLLRRSAARPETAAACARTAKTNARSLAVFALATLLLALAFGYAGCGGGSGSSAPPAGQPGTPAGTYQVNVSATAGSLAQSTTVNLTVQ